MPWGAPGGGAADLAPGNLGPRRARAPEVSVLPRRGPPPRPAGPPARLAFYLGKRPRQNAARKVETPRKKVETKS